VKSTRQVTAVLRSGDTGFEALCPELDLTAVGEDAEAALRALGEAMERCLQETEPADLRVLLAREVRLAHLEVEVEWPDD